jgi:hypothetical protein
VFYRGVLGSRETWAAALLQSASLPFIVAVTQIGVEVGAITSANAAALVAAGLVSVLLYPVVALRLLTGGAPRMSSTAMSAMVAADAM